MQNKKVGGFIPPFLFVLFYTPEGGQKKLVGITIEAN
jgi:hypothetical protein